jgi:hypothetical protein
MQNLEKLLEALLNDLVTPEGVYAFDRYASQNDLDARIIEFRTLISGLSPEAKYLLDKFDKDGILQSDNAQNRLQRLVAYCRTTLELLRNGVVRSRGFLLPAPDFSRLTVTMPGLDYIIASRWKEAQICQHAGSYLSAIILMGSILEALIFSRAMINAAETLRSKESPREKDGKIKPLQDWNLNELLLVAIDMGWLKARPGDFNAALRKFRFLVQPWGEASCQVEVSAEVSQASWKILNKSVEDLLQSM